MITESSTMVKELIPARTRFLAISFPSPFMPMRRTSAKRRLDTISFQYRLSGAEHTAPELALPIILSDGRIRQSHLIAG